MLFYSHVFFFFFFCFFSDLFSVVITSLGEERAGLYASSAFVCLSCTPYFLFLFWCQGLAVACHFGPLCTFLLTRVHG